MNTDLHYLRGSPWSLKTMWTFAHLPDEVKSKVQPKAMMQANSLSSKVYSFSKKHKLTTVVDAEHLLSLPMMFHSPSKDAKEGEVESDKVLLLREGYDIVEYLMEAAEKSATKGEDTFCAHFLANKSEMKEWNERVLKGLRYGRGQACVNDCGDNIPQYLLPRWLGYIPGFFTLVGYMVGRTLKNKYLEQDLKITQEEVEATLDKAMGILEHATFLVGNKFSFADIAFCTLLEFIVPSQFEKPLGFA